MSTKRTRDSPQFKCQLALEAAKGLKTINELASAHGVHPTQVSEWKRQLLEAGSTVFSRDGARPHREQQEREVELYEHIGRLKMDLEWLKKTTVVKLTREAPKAVPMQRDTPLNHDERASTCSV
jgi:transposase-like protein